VDVRCLVDAFETTGWLERRLVHQERLDFVRGDFASRDFMRGLRVTGEVGVAFDVLLQQASLVEALHLMLTKVGRRFVVVQPALDELGVPQASSTCPATPRPTCSIRSRHRRTTTPPSIRCT
jgi:hypothetical protein